MAATASAVLKTIVRWIEFAIEWTLRPSLAAVALVVPIAIYGSGSWWWVPAVPFSALAALWVVLPKAAGRVWRWAVAGPYYAYFVPYVVEPIEAGFAWLGKVVARLLVGAFWVVLAIAGFGLTLVVAVFALKGIAALPVSVAVVVGALIIANAVQSRR